MTEQDLPTAQSYSQLTWQGRRALREQYIYAQNGKCFYCEDPLDEKPSEKIRNAFINWSQFPENFLLHPIHLQHDHKTGMTEGAVHANCNAYMWQHEGR